MNFQENQYFEEKQSVYYDLIKKILKFKCQSNGLESHQNIKDFFLRLNKKYEIFKCQVLRKRIFEFLIQNVTESIDARSINLLKFYLNGCNASNPSNESLELIYLLKFKDFKKVISLFEPNCLIDEIMYNNIYSISKPKMKNGSKKVVKVIKKIYKERGKLFLYEKLLIKFPEYLKLTNKTFKSLMLKEGYINITWRFYIAIIAVSYSQCNYLLRCLEELFIFYGGDKNWLVYGIKIVPEKLQKIAKLNEILASHPNKLQVCDILELLSKKNSYQSWNINEIVQASAIICQFQKLASFSHCLGIEIPFYTMSEENLISISPKYIRKTKDNDVFNKHTLASIYHNSTWIEQQKESIVSYYEFNWFDNAFDILAEIYPEGIHSIDNEFNLINGKKIKQSENLLDKFEYRRCINCYSEWLLGYQHDDYNYSKINKNLSISVRDFIKNVILQPSSICKKDIEEIKLTFSSLEIIELILLTLNIKNRLQLTVLSLLIMNVRRSIDT